MQIKPFAQVLTGIVDFNYSGFVLTQRVRLTPLHVELLAYPLELVNYFLSS
jgi:hypothetical protein